jgi:hypothetical protein
MAFNPFKYFRKHRKVLIVGLIVLTMIIFVFSFGPGDLFQTLLARFGGGRDQGPAANELYGDEVKREELLNLLDRREMANDFLLAVLGQALPRALKEAGTRIDTLSSEKAPNQQVFRDLLRGPQGGQVFFPGVEGRQGSLVQIRRFRSSQFANIYLQTYTALLQDLERLRSLSSDPEVHNDSEQAFIYNALLAACSFQAWFLNPNPTDPFLFGGAPVVESLLDHKIWLEQADRLGITLTEADLVKAINQEAGGRDVFEGQPFSQATVVLNFIRDQRPTHPRGPVRTPKSLLASLVDEYRVVLAQEALLGVGPSLFGIRSTFGIARSPSTPSPAQFLAYYREQLTKVNVAMLEVPVEDPEIQAEVKGQPSASELLYRFNKYKDQEPDPGRREPGFKKPRQIAIQYVSASPEDPYYKKKATEDAQELARYTNPRDAGLRLTLPTPLAHGAGLAGSLASASIRFLGIGLLSDPIRSEYKAYVERQPRWTDRFLGEKELHESSIYRTENAAALVGQAITWGALGGVPYASVATFTGSATHAEVKDSLRFNLGLLLSRAGQYPLASLIPALDHLPKPLSLEQVRSRFTGKIEEQIATRLVAANLDAFSKEMQDDKKKFENDPEAAASLAEEYDLQFHSMARGDLRTIYDIEDDPVIKKWKEELGKSASRDLNVRLFGGQQPRVGTYDPEPVFGSGSREYRFWRIEDKPARVREYNAATRKLVLKEWKREQGRVIAQKRANKIAQLAREKKKEWSTDKEVLRTEVLGFLNQESLPNTNPFTLVGVSQLTLDPRIQPGAPRSYRPYQVPESREEDIPYPPANLAEKLTQLTEPGDTVVVADAPVDRFYVAILLDRDGKTLEDFYTTYAHTRDLDPLWTRIIRELRAEYSSALLIQLRREAQAKLDEKGAYIIPDEARISRDEFGQ